MDTTTPLINSTTPFPLDEIFEQYRGWILFASGVVFICPFVLFCCACIRGFCKDCGDCSLGDCLPCECTCDCTCDDIMDLCRCRLCSSVIVMCVGACMSKCSLLCERLSVCITDSNATNTNVAVPSAPPVTIPMVYRQNSGIDEYHTDSEGEASVCTEAPPPSYDSVVSDPYQPPPSYEKVMQWNWKQLII